MISKLMQRAVRQLRFLTARVWVCPLQGHLYKGGRCPTCNTNLSV